MVTTLTEVRLGLGLTGGETLLVVISKQLIEEINGFVGDVSLVFRRDETGPGLPGVPWEKAIKSDNHCGIANPYLPSSSSYWESKRILYFSMYA